MRTLIRSLCLGVLFAWALAANATTTTTSTSTSTSSTSSTSTSSTSSTTIAGGGVLTCVVDFETVNSGMYFIVGRVTMSNSYQTGGDRFHFPNSMGDAAMCLCRSSHRIPKTVLVTGTGTDGRHYAYDSSAFTIKAFTGTGTTEETQATDLHATVLSYMAACQ